jgi:CBS domain-containing protein
MDRFTIM